MLVWLATPTIRPRYLTGGHKSTGNSQFNIRKAAETVDFSNIQGNVTKSVNVTFLFRLEGFLLNDTDWINKLKEQRTQYGVSQNRLAVMAGFSREYISRLESGKVALTEEIKVKLTDALDKLNPDNPLEMVFDYVRIRFPTQDVKHVVEDILKLKLDVMIHEDFDINKLKEQRTQYGVSQNRLAVMAGFSREYISRLESGKVALTEEIKVKLTDALDKLNPDNPLEMVFDYVRIRFPTQDVKHVVEDILKLKLDVMIHEDFGFYSYAEHYVLGDVFVLTSPDKEKGILLELKGKGCRQMESYLLAQHRSWYDFLMDALIEGGVMKRLDLAINDMAGILDIPELTEKCNHEECISVFRSFKSYRSGELVRSHEQDRYGMGNTLYIGSLKSEVYFCIYEKDYEQYVKYEIPIEDTKIKNRFEIRLKNERAYYAVRDLLTYHDAERTAFDIINRYMRFADKEVEKRRSEWKTNEKWAYFIGSDRGRLKLTTKPEPYTLTRTLNWISRQVAPTWKVLQEIDSTNGTTYLKDILESAKLTERHRKLIEQQTISTEEIISKEE